jgi:hypothetical protein
MEVELSPQRSRHIHGMTRFRAAVWEAEAPSSVVTEHRQAAAASRTNATVRVKRRFGIVIITLDSHYL